MAALTTSILIYILLASGKVDSAIDNIEPMTRKVGEFVDFLWNASLTPIIGSQWGLPDPSGDDPPKPLFVSTRITSSNAAFSIDPEYKDRVHFIGDLWIGHAWFRLTDLKTSDTNQYRATMHENGGISLPFTVSHSVSINYECL
ncbi:uncharacterized protein LOC116289998 [Actinia tenebrosa]|uniref:Uncharacterized protein LOC116289998 n=1 Tax=Actinia tenebrosa TaxID=6105 RepID=A0A6P8H8S7_ACTTE|nr:uncharacterized protein LOC116289998 [Actinia tenebrosa]